MAYIEVRKQGKLLKRRYVDDQKANKGCTFRLGNLGKVVLKVGETKHLGLYELALVVSEGDSGSWTISEKDLVHDNILSFSATRTHTSPVADASAPPPHIEGYEIERPLGKGGMGVVWLALQLSTKRHVALKFLSPGSFASDTAKARFEREVALSARLAHPNIATVYESGLHQGVYYYAMALIEGVHLDRFVAEAELSQHEILSLMKKVCMAVEYAHGEGIIHRDLKPSNILVTADGEPHILDFGLAKAREKEQGELTLSIEGQIAGTPTYMSPEQAVGDIETIDVRSDVYSLGVILYELLTGTTPHDMIGKRYEVLRRIAEEEVRRPRQVCHGINRDLESLLLKALAQQPHDRYSSAATLGFDIDHYLNGDPLAASGISVTYWIRKHAGKSKRIVAALVFIGIALAVALTAGSYFLDQVEYTQTVVNDLGQELQQKEAELQNNRLSSRPSVSRYPGSTIQENPYISPRARSAQDNRFSRFMPNSVLYDQTRSMRPQEAPSTRIPTTRYLLSNRPTEPGEMAAERLITRLKQSMEEQQWQEAWEQLEYLKKNYSRTQEVQRREAHIKIWEKQIQEGLRSSKER